MCVYVYCVVGYMCVYVCECVLCGMLCVYMCVSVYCVVCYVCTVKYRMYSKVLSKCPPPSKIPTSNLKGTSSKRPLAKMD